MLPPTRTPIRRHAAHELNIEPFNAFPQGGHRLAGAFASAVDRTHLLQVGEETLAQMRLDADGSPLSSHFAAGGESGTESPVHRAWCESPPMLSCLSPRQILHNLSVWGDDRFGVQFASGHSLQERGRAL